MLKNRRENPNTECKYLYEFKESKSSPFENKGLSIAINSILVLIPVPSKISITISIQSAISDIDIFLDKKKIAGFPRYIKLKRIGFPKVSEMKNSNLINSVLFKIFGY